jgi:hypothetical protein
MELIIGEGADGHIVPELTAAGRTPQTQPLAITYRRQFKKPVISTNSPSLGISYGDTEALHLYQWYSLLAKVQEVGVYAKDFQLNPLNSPPGMVYAQRSETLASFFDTITDYASLDLASAIIAPGAPGKYRMALSSPQEIVVYRPAGDDCSCRPVAGTESGQATGR